MKTAVAIITARGGSKRVPGKNIRIFAGKPMIAWPIETALSSGLFDRVIVSTDSTNIASVAREYGAEVPFMRPAELADDYTDTASVLRHALDWLAAHKCLPEYACCIYPTAPFLEAKYLQSGLDSLMHSNAPGSFSVTTFDFPVMKALKQCADGSVEFNWPENALCRTQDLPELFHDAGQFYWVRTEAFMASACLIMSGMLPVLLPRKIALDIDTVEDIEFAELMAKAIGLGGS